MVYTPTVWVDGGPPAINAANLNKIEAALGGLDTRADILADPVLTTVSAVPLGATIIDGTGWTLGAGWAGDFATGFVHTPGSTEALTRAVATGADRYLVTLTVTTPTNNSDFTTALGGAAPAYMYNGATSPMTYQVGFLSVASGDLVFTPGTTFDGTITDISVRKLTAPATPSVTPKAADGTAGWEAYTRPAAAGTLALGVSTARWDVSGAGNVHLGTGPGSSNISGFWNVSMGWRAGRSLVNGSRNTLLGMKAGEFLTSAYRDTYIGQCAGRDTTTGRENIAVGADALILNTTGNENVAIGLAALTGCVTGSRNIALGTRAMHGVGPAAADNIGIGNLALAKVTTGTRIVAIGTNALAASTNAASDSVIIGDSAGANLTSGDRNIALGAQALKGAVGTTALRNIAIGYQAGVAIDGAASYNTIVGTSAGTTLTTGSYNILIGAGINTTSATSSSQMNLGNTLWGDLTGKRVGIGVNPTFITAALHIKAGTAAAGTAPLKLQQGVLLTTPEAGAIEYDGTNLYFTSAAGARKTLAVVP